jgi:hypothetical protein
LHGISKAEVNSALMATLNSWRAGCSSPLHPAGEVVDWQAGLTNFRSLANLAGSTHSPIKI